MHSAPTPRRPRPATDLAYWQRQAGMPPTAPLPPAAPPSISERLLTLCLRLLGVVLLALLGLLLWPQGQPTHPLSLPDTTATAPASEPAYGKHDFYYE